jgi:hypothetical protein
MTLLVTVRPGPVLHVWRDGVEVAAVPLTWRAALVLASDLIKAVAAEKE